MKAVQFTLKNYLEANGLTAYRLAQQAKGRVSRGTVYALAKGSAQRLDLGTLGAVMTALEELTGHDITPADLLEAFTLPQPDKETQEWLAGDLSRLGEFEPYDFQGQDPYTMGQPVRLGADGQIIIGEQ